MQRLQFLIRVARRECEHLKATDGRLFVKPFTVEPARGLDDNNLEAVRICPQRLF